MELKEQWKQIEGFPDYEISNFGNVASRKFGKYRILTGGIPSNGYRLITLSKDGAMHSTAIHILVWDHFGGNPRSGRKVQVDHIDNDKLNNGICNLQLLTARQNSSKKCKAYYKTSKYTGVSWHKQRKGGSWRSQIKIKGSIKHLGAFKTELEAHEAYQKALKEIM